MRTGTAIVVVGSVALIGGSLWIYGRKYYDGIQQLQYGLVGVGIRGNEWIVEIAVDNPTNFRYPVPAMFFNVYDRAGNYLGALHSVQMQWVQPRGWSKLTAWLVPNLAAVISSIVYALVPGEELNIELRGGLTIGGYQYPLTIPITQKLS